ncbi:19265_t:CDS:1, partial [Gigaspora margarita]
YPKLRCHIGAMKSDRELHRAKHLVERSPLSVIDVLALSVLERTFLYQNTRKRASEKL